MKRKICAYIGSRANYASIKSALRAIKKKKNLELQIILAASGVLDKYGDLEKIILSDGFKINSKIYSLLEGENPITMAKTTGYGLVEITTELSKLKPEFLVVVGDRYETLSATIAAAYLNIKIAHTMGGEITGTIDESIRHANTKFAHVHFPSSKKAKKNIINLGEDPKNVFHVGCPRIDLAKEVLKKKKQLDGNAIFKHGVGTRFNLGKDFLVLSQHPVTTEYEHSMNHILNSLEALKFIGLPTLVFWPNSDAGSDGVSRGIRLFREKNKKNNFFFIKNLPTNHYLNILNYTKCLIGNSSSGIREGSYLGTPVVNIGTRQTDRERASNVIEVKNNKLQIINAIKKQIKHGKYKSSKIYGQGDTGIKIAKILSKVSPKIQKKLLTR